MNQLGTTAGTSVVVRFDKCWLKQLGWDLYLHIEGRLLETAKE